MVSQKLIAELRGGKVQSMNLSFAGCGFLGIYHVGVATCIREYAPHLVADKISGASAGSLVASALICNLGLGDATTFTLNLATKARARALGPLHPSFDIVRHLRAALESFLPDNCHEIATGRLFVSLTRVSDRKNVLVSQFDSKEDLIQALLCSSHVPFYSGIFPPKYKGVRYVDGGISVNNPILDDNTITVSPFAGECDICPDDNSASFLHVSLAGTSVQLNSGNLYRISHAFFPPPPEVLSDMCRQGFDDALKFLQKNNLISCAKHLSIQSSIRSSEAIDLRRLAQEDTSSESDGISLPETLEDFDSSSDEEREEAHHCDECKQQQESLMLKSLPPTVVSALQAACDSVNSGLLARVYKLRAYKVLSLLTAPWILPLDVGIVFAKKFYEWAPYMPADMQWFVMELGALIKELINMIQTGRHHYSARFTCQLAITDINYAEMEQIVSSSSHHHHHHTHADSARIPTRRRNLGVGLAVNFHARKKSPLKCVNELRHQMVKDEGHRHFDIQEEHMEEVQRLGSPQVIRRRSSGESGVIGHAQSPEGLQSSEIAPASEQGAKASSWEPQEFSQMHYDTFENCLHIADQMDSLLSFYYMEENNPNTIKVTEIFPIKDSMHNQNPTPPEPEPVMDSANDLAWDNFLQRQITEEEKAVGSKRKVLRRCQSEMMSGYLAEDEVEAEDSRHLPCIKEDLSASSSSLDSDAGIVLASAAS